MVENRHSPLSDVIWLYTHYNIIPIACSLYMQIYCVFCDIVFSCYIAGMIKTYCMSERTVWYINDLSHEISTSMAHRLSAYLICLC